VIDKPSFSGEAKRRPENLVTSQLVSEMVGSSPTMTV